MKLNERLISVLLAKNGIAHKRETSIGELDQHFNHDADDYSKRLRFDYYIPDRNLVIEFDGQQHFNVVDYFGGIGSFMSTHTNDVLKINYCKRHRIRMIRLHHDTTDVELERSLELSRRLGDDFYIITVRDGIYNVDPEATPTPNDVVTYYQSQLDGMEARIEQLIEDNHALQEMLGY